MSVLSNLTTARRCTFTLTSFHSLCVQILLCCLSGHECVQSQNLIHWFVDWRRFSGKHLVCMAWLFAAFSGKSGIALSEHDSQEFVWVGRRRWVVVMCYWLIRYSCNQVWKWSVTWGVFQGSVGNYSGGTQLLLCLLSLPFLTLPQQRWSWSWQKREQFIKPGICLD